MNCKDCDRLNRFTNICSYYFNTPSARQAQECEHFSPRVEGELSDYECKSASLKFLASQGGPWCMVLYEAAEAIDSLREEFKQVKRERDEAVRFCGKLFALCSPPKKWWPKLFRCLPARVGDYMGSGYSFVDLVNRIIDEFTETAEESLYSDVVRAVEKEVQRYKNWEG